MQCKKCFFKEQVLKKKRPGIDRNTVLLHNTIDLLLKDEFDYYRQQQKAHPIMIQNNIDAIPFAHNSLYIWRDYRAGGISYLDKKTNIRLSGIIDDIWINRNGELILVDYKTTSQCHILNPNNKWNQVNQKQLSFYASLFRNNGYKIHHKAYFLYNIPIKKSQFNLQLDFEAKMQPSIIDDSWIETTLFDLRDCLNQKELPAATWDCEYCKFDLEGDVH
jgi:hypothetical protein